jgi:muconolactone delta-isomerase
VASTENYLYFRYESPDRQSVGIQQINRQTREKKMLASSADEMKLRMLRRNAGDYWLLTRAKIPDDRKVFEEYSWIRKILYQPNASTLKKVGETLCLFNTVELTAESFSPGGEFLSMLKLSVKQIPEGEWTAEFYVDDPAGTIYTSFINNGLITLFRIDLNTGDLKRVQTTEHAFLQKIRIQNHCLYYLYKTPGAWENKRLFAQKI